MLPEDVTRRQWPIYQCVQEGHGQIRVEKLGHNQKMIDGVECFETRYYCQSCGYKLIGILPRAVAALIVDERCFPPPLQTS